MRIQNFQTIHAFYKQNTMKRDIQPEENMVKPDLQIQKKFAQKLDKKIEQTQTAKKEQSILSHDEMDSLALMFPDTKQKKTEFYNPDISKSQLGLFLDLRG